MMGAQEILLTIRGWIANLRRAAFGTRLRAGIFGAVAGILALAIFVTVLEAIFRLPGDGRLVLGEVKALKFGSMVRPGEALEVEVTLSKELEDGSFLCRGTGRVRRPGVAGGQDRAEDPKSETTVSGRFTMRPIRRS